MQPDALNPLADGNLPLALMGIAESGLRHGASIAYALDRRQSTEKYTISIN
jgi:hypothetical protein